MPEELKFIKEAPPPEPKVKWQRLSPRRYRAEYGGLRVCANYPGEGLPCPWSVLALGNERLDWGRASNLAAAQAAAVAAVDRLLRELLDNTPPHPMTSIAERLSAAGAPAPPCLFQSRLL